MRDVAKAVVSELRLALLSPSELTALEEENKKDQMIPVRDITSHIARNSHILLVMFVSFNLYPAYIISFSLSLSDYAECGLALCNPM